MKNLAAAAWGGMAILFASSCHHEAKHVPGQHAEKSNDNEFDFNRALARAQLIETQPDGTQVFFRPLSNPHVRLRPSVEVEFVILTRPAKRTSIFQLTGMAYDGSCSHDRLSAVHGAGIGWNGEFTSMDADETPFTPKQASVEGKAIRRACDARARSMSKSS
jgi:hypothetical protein